jgi:NADPH:quinone reductase-like Zn-dependent oxidoreductase
VGESKLEETRELTMRAVVHESFGSPDTLEIREIEKPTPEDDQVLVRVRASSVNPAEWYEMVGRPLLFRFSTGWRKPKTERIGTDYGGIVEAVGKDVREFKPGDEVFGGRSGALAEYVCVPQGRGIAAKPKNITFEQAGAVGIAGVTALQALRDKGGVQPGHKVLINGASGGVGTFAIQIGKALGAEVTAVCSTQNVPIAQSLGADRVIDYTQVDFSQDGQSYNLILDIAGNRHWSDYKRVLPRVAKLLIVGGPKDNRLIGPLSHIIGTKMAATGSGRNVSFFVASINKEDLQTLSELMESGKVTPQIDKEYQLDNVGEAFSYLGEGHAHGKVVVLI